MSFCMNRNKLLIPEEPQGTEQEIIEQMDFKLNEGKREEYKDTSNRLERFCQTLFAQYRCKAYIGRAWQHLILLVQSRNK